MLPRMVRFILLTELMYFHCVYSLQAGDTKFKNQRLEL